MANDLTKPENCSGAVREPMSYISVTLAHFFSSATSGSYVRGRARQHPLVVSARSSMLNKKETSIGQLRAPLVMLHGALQYISIFSVQ